MWTTCCPGLWGCGRRLAGIHHVLKLFFHGKELTEEDRVSDKSNDAENILQHVYMEEIGFRAAAALLNMDRQPLSRKSNEQNHQSSADGNRQTDTQNVDEEGRSGPL